jgi:ribosomal protein S18 acetylase RimI-like enzyme
MTETNMRFMEDLSLIRGLEERAGNAWPAFRTLLVDGWVVRLAEGFSKRSNSACAYVPFARPVGAVIEEIEAIYRRAGQPAIIRLTPLAASGDGETLERRGYTPLDDTHLMTRRLSEVDSAGDPALHVASLPDEAWLDAFGRHNNHGPAYRETVRRVAGLIAQDTVFAALVVDGAAVAWGHAVVERGLVGLFNIVVDPAQRRCGHAARLTRALIGWGRERGAHFAYLQVTDDNTPAKALYEGLGFTRSYMYRYWKKAI